MLKKSKTKKKNNLFKDIWDYIVLCIKEEYKFLIVLVLLFILFTWPVNYYIVVGGGISNIDSRIKVEDGYKSKGSFNISYVTELEGKIFTYLLSYVIPSWERESVDDYKYVESEELDDIAFRGDLDLKSANSTAIYYAYTLANKEIKEISRETYVIVIFDEYKTKLKIQDQLLGVNGTRFNSVEEYKEYIQQFNEGDTVDVLVKRNNKEITVKCPIYVNEGTKILGVALQTVTEYDTDPDIDIKFRGSESGPSGGLMTTLDIYNKLTKKDLTNNLDIAGTGTINTDGSIGQIGGVNYKLLGAVNGGADVFLVPDGKNYKTCAKLKKEKKLKIKLIKVKNIEDAINKLEKLKK